MATSYAAEIDQIDSTHSLEDIFRIAGRFSASATGHDGILYSGNVARVADTTTSSIHSHGVATMLADRHGLSIVDNTERGKFLGDKPVETAIRTRATALFEARGLDAVEARKAALDFVYGDSHAPVGSVTSVENSLWGRTSRDFVSSLKGDVTVVATRADPERVLGRVELPTALQTDGVRTVGGVSGDVLRRQVAATGEPAAALPAAQASFREAARTGLFHSADGTQVELSREAARTLALDGARHLPAAELRAGGYLLAEPIAAEGLRAVAGVAVAGSVVTKGLGVAGGATMLYDAATTARHYAALARGGNDIGADAVAGRYAGRTGGGVLGGMAAGTAYGALAGVETGPGVLATSLIGGVAGAVGGEALARAHERHQTDHQTGTDGRSYAYRGGTWEHRPWIGAATPAPAGERAVLDYRRETRVVDTAMADIGDPQATARVARAYVMDYYGRGWDRAGPLPDAVSGALNMRHEQTVRDPDTGRDWTFDGRDYARTGVASSLLGPSRPAGGERARLDEQRAEAVADNRHQGAALIDRVWAATRPPTSHAGAAAESDAARSLWQAVARQGLAATQPHQDQTQDAAAAQQHAPTARPALRLR